jgi:hypothetical protein
MKIIITIEVPNGTDVSFADSGPDLTPGELESLSGVTATQQFVPQQITAPQPVVRHVNPTCPEHHTSKMVPGGISKRTGKQYLAFWGCTEMNCKWTQDAA